MSCAVKFLINHMSNTVTENIHLVKEGILSLGVHKSVKFIKCFVALCSDRLPSHLDTSSLENTINGEYD